VGHVVIYGLGERREGRDGKDKAEPGTGHGSGMVGPVVGYAA